MGYPTLIANQILDASTGGAAFTKAATAYLALLTVIPDDTSTGASIVEANYTGYARKTVANSDWGAAAGGQKANVNAIVFASCTGGSSTLLAFGLCDALTVGNLIAWGLINNGTGFAVTSGVIPQFLAGALLLTEHSA